MHDRNVWRGGFVQLHFRDQGAEFRGSLRRHQKVGGQQPDQHGFRRCRSDILQYRECCGRFALIP